MIWLNNEVLAYFLYSKNFHLSSLTSWLVIKKIPMASLKVCMLHILSLLFVLSFPFPASCTKKKNYRRQSVTKHAPVRVQFHLQLLLKLVSYLLQGAPGVFYFLLQGYCSWSNSHSYFQSQVTLSPCTMWLLT